MKPWLRLNAEAAKAIEECKENVTLECTCNDFRFSVEIPADASLQKFVDEHGCVCVVCLAEEFGYEVLDPEE